MVVEEKNEFGDGGSDPSVQASFSFVHVIREVQCFATLMRVSLFADVYHIACGPSLKVQLSGLLSCSCWTLASSSGRRLHREVYSPTAYGLHLDPSPLCT